MDQGKPHPRRGPFLSGLPNCPQAAMAPPPLWCRAGDSVDRRPGAIGGTRALVYRAGACTPRRGRSCRGSGSRRPAARTPRTPRREGPATGIPSPETPTACWTNGLPRTVRSSYCFVGEYGDASHFSDMSGSSSVDSPTTVFFPGLGADSSLAKYHELVGVDCVWVEWPDLIAPDWDNFADSLLRQIPSGVPLRFIGISFGGLAALKMAEHLHLDGGVFLIGAPTSRSDLRWPFRLALPFVRWLPIAAFDLRILPKCVIGHFFGIHESRHLDEFLVMASRIPARSVKNLCYLIRRWDPPSNIDVRRIHGTNDRIIKPDPRSTKIVGGGHLISMTHSEEVNAWLEYQIE